MAKIANTENLFYEKLIAETLELEMSAKRALYWVDHPEAASQIAAILATTWRIRAAVIERNKLRHEEPARSNGKVN